MYNFNKPTGFSEETGHFTQLVWKGTREVGCAAVDCGLTDPDGDGEKKWSRAQGWYVVCEYMPGGNVVGAKDDLEYFRTNVQKGSGDVDVDTDSDSDSESSGDDDGPMWSGDGGGLLRLSSKGIGWWIGIVVYIFNSI